MAYTMCRGGRWRLYQEQEKRCYLCGELMYFGKRWKKTPPWNYATLDHVVPLSRGGGDTNDNRRMACRRCNEDKANLTADEYLALRAYRRENRA